LFLLTFIIRRIKMDSKLVKDSRLADLLLSREHVVAEISEIPGASISGTDVLLDLSKFGDDADVLVARIGSEEASSIVVAAGVATIGFTAPASSDILEVVVKLALLSPDPV
jgi:hypothetical protein